MKTARSITITILRNDKTMSFDVIPILNEADNRYQLGFYFAVGTRNRFLPGVGHVICSDLPYCWTYGRNTERFDICRQDGV